MEIKFTYTKTENIDIDIDYIVDMVIAENELTKENFDEEIFGTANEFADNLEWYIQDFLGFNIAEKYEGAEIPEYVIGDIYHEVMVKLYEKFGVEVDESMASPKFITI